MAARAPTRWMAVTGNNDVFVFGTANELFTGTALADTIIGGTGTDTLLTGHQQAQHSANTLDVVFAATNASGLGIDYGCGERCSAVNRPDSERKRGNRREFGRLISLAITTLWGLTRLMFQPIRLQSQQP